MKNFLIFLSVLVIVLPILFIIQNFTGWSVISLKEYFFLVGAYLILIVIYKLNRKKQEV